MIPSLIHFDAFQRGIWIPLSVRSSPSQEMAPSAQARSLRSVWNPPPNLTPIQSVWNLTVPPMTQRTHSLFSNSSANTVVGPRVALWMSLRAPFNAPPTLGCCSSLLLQGSFYRAAKVDLKEGVLSSPSEAHNFEWIPTALRIKSQLLTS